MKQVAFYAQYPIISGRTHKVTHADGSLLASVTPNGANASEICASFVTKFNEPVNDAGCTKNGFRCKAVQAGAEGVAIVMVVADDAIASNVVLSVPLGELPGVQTNVVVGGATNLLTIQADWRKVPAGMLTWAEAIALATTTAIVTK